MNPKKRIIIACFAFAMLFMLAAGARVFMKLPSDPAILLDSAGGKLVYDSPVEINGAQARIGVYAFAENARDIGARLLPRLGADPGELREGAMIRLPKSYGNALLVLMPAEEEDRASALLVTSATDFALADKPEWGFRDIPQPQGFTPGFSAFNSETATGICIGQSTYQDAIAMQLVVGEMEDAGWNSVTPGAERLTSAIFTHGDAVAVVSTTARDAGCGMLIMRKAAERSR